jgi:photosystem II stability/assembly factor-like uncharacterized protein
MSAIGVSPTDPNRYLVAGADGGVWRTVDGGATWQNVTDHLPTSSIGAIAIAPSNESRVYVGTGEANFANHSRYGLGIYRSDDGGLTWDHLAESTFAGRCISRIVVSSLDQELLFAGVTGAGGFPALAGAKGHPDAAGPLGVFRSFDGGETWEHLTNGVPAVDATEMAIDPSDPQVVYAAIGHIFGHPENGVYRSVDGGDTWTRLSGGLPTTGFGRVGLAIAHSDPERLYCVLVRPADATGGGGTVLSGWRSNDGGDSWTAMAGFPVGGPTYGWYFGRLHVKPTNADELYFGSLAVHRSTNGGATFSTSTPPHPDVHAFETDAAGRLVVGDDGGIHRTTFVGAYEVLNGDIGTIQFYAGLSIHPTDPVKMLGGLQDNGCVLRTSDSSLVWNHVTSGDGGWTEISPHDPNVMFTESQGTGQLYRSTNGGSSFSGVGSGLSGRNCFLPPFVLDPAVPGRMLYATERVWVSTNNGTSFAPLSPDLTDSTTAAIRALAIAPSDARRVYAATNNGRVLASEDGGATFELRLTGVAGWPRVTREIVPDRYDPATVYLAGATFGAPHVRRSTDGGATWQTLDGNLPDVPVNVIGVDNRGVSGTLYAGADDGVYRSIDDGQNWTRFGDNLAHTAVIDLRVEPARNRMVVSTQGRGAWLVSLPCPVDYNADDLVDILDFLLFIDDFASLRVNADHNGDTLVDILDFLEFIDQFSEGCS